MTTSESDEANKSHMSQDNWRSEKSVPCDRPGDDEDMAQGIMMLASNRYVNGQTLVIDGGLLFGMVSLILLNSRDKHDQELIPLRFFVCFRMYSLKSASPSGLK